jgi:hypothetical protein
MGRVSQAWPENQSGIATARLALTGLSISVALEPYQRPNVLTRPSHKAPSSAPIGWSLIEAVLATAV